jgi:cystathionine beta-lyase/cystathionine gamma-synthase
MKKHTENAQEIAEILSKHPKVNKVFYPGLPNHKGHDLAKKQMRAFGAIVSFELHDSVNAVDFQKNLEFIMPSVSLGGVESLITSPFLTSHKFVSPEDRKKMGISDQMLRLSVGIEEVEDIMFDINQAIEKLSK